MTETIEIKIDLTELPVGDGGTTLPEYIANVAALRLLNGMEHDVRSDFSRRLRQITDEEIREHVRPLIGEAMQRAVQPTDTFGNAKGEPESFHELIVKMIAAELKRRPEYGRDGETLLSAWLRKEVQDAFGKELRETIAAAKGDVLAAVRERAGEVISETIDRLAAGRTL